MDICRLFLQSRKKKQLLHVVYATKFNVPIQVIEIYSSGL